jgi:hypothetical protein
VLKFQLITYQDFSLVDESDLTFQGETFCQKHEMVASEATQDF